MGQEKSNVRRNLLQVLLSSWQGLSIRYKLLITVLAVFIVGVGAFGLSLLAPINNVVDTAAQQRLSLLSQVVAERVATILVNQQGALRDIAHNVAFRDYKTALESSNGDAASTALVNLQNYLTDVIQANRVDFPFVEFHYLDSTGRVVARAI